MSDIIEITDDAGRPAVSGNAGAAAASVDGDNWLAAAIIDSCSEAILSVSLDTRIFTWNAAAERLAGYASHEVIGKSWHMLTRPDEALKIQRAIERFRRDEKTFRFETQLVRKDGAEREILLSISQILDRSGAVVGLSGLLRDIGEEKLAEKKLRQSEEKFKTIFQHSTDAVSIASLVEAKYLDVNDEFCRLVGLSREEVIGKTPIDLGFFTLGELLKFAEGLFQTGTVRNHEVVRVRPDGSPGVYLISAAIVEIDGMQCSLGICKDITDLKRAEDGLRETERQLTDVLANAPLALIAVDPNCVITACRGRAVESVGNGAEKLVGKTISEVFSATGAVLSHMRRALAGESFVETVSLSGGAFIFESWYSPVRDSHNRVTGAIAIGTDITARTKAEEELRRSEEYHRSLVESSADLTVVSNQEGFIIFAAGEGRKDLGYEISELIGARVLDYIHPDKVEEQIRRIGACYSQPNYAGRGEAPIKCKDGSYLDCELIGRATIGPNGKTILVSTVRNISERKRIEAEIAKGRDQALAASRAKSEFLSSMSHEIRTPMNAILGMADLMWESQLSTEQRRYLETVINNGNSLLELINSILDLAKVESGRLSLESVDFDLRELLEKIADTLTLRADEKGVELGVRIDPDVPTELIGDPLRLRQVVTNLVGNAIKFTEKGAVVVRVRRNPDRSAEGSLLFSVADSGIGIPADKLSCLFDPFSQADSSVTRKYGGTGLGLAIVDRLVRLMGGKVGVESEAGRGSTFYFTSEFKLQQGCVAGRHSDPAEIDLHGIKVLVVDDNETNRIILREMLSPSGATVVEAASGPEGVELFQRALHTPQPFKLLIADQLMPGMDGLEMVARIRAISGASDLAIMMLSSVDLPDTLAKVRRLGIGLYIIKPIKRAELYTAISHAMTNVAPYRMTPLAREGRHVRLSETILERPLRILLADDSPDNRLLIRAYLRKTPYKLDEAEDGRMATDLAFAGNYDLILMDIQMPLMDGYTAVRHIREWEARTERKRVPIIALTASALDEAVRHTREVGFDQHVSKPVKRATLLNAIAEACAEPPPTLQSLSQT